MNPQTPWTRLVAGARRAPGGGDVAAPYGFATRVAARAMAAGAARTSFFEEFSLRMALRALGVACLLAVAAAGAGYPSLVKIFSAPSPAASASPLPGRSAAPAAKPAAAPAETLPSTAPSSDDPVAEVIDSVS